MKLGCSNLQYSSTVLIMVQKSVRIMFVIIQFLLNSCSKIVQKNNWISVPYKINLLNNNLSENFRSSLSLFKFSQYKKFEDSYSILQTNVPFELFFVWSMLGLVRGISEQKWHHILLDSFTK